MCVGIGIVNVLMNLIGHPSQKYGIPFPVMARLSFGVMGANMAEQVVTCSAHTNPMSRQYTYTNQEHSKTISEISRKPKTNNFDESTHV